MLGIATSISTGYMPPLRHDFRPWFPLFQQTNALGQWCCCCQQWIEPQELDGTCPGKPLPRPVQELAYEDRPDWHDAG
jgi:hypothetical protein